MAEGHLLKSSGRVTCQGQQMYYELLLNSTQYLLKFYDSYGKVRLIRPITLPTKSVEIFGAGEYLFCYETVSDGLSSGIIHLLKLSDLRSTMQKYKLNLKCSMEEQKKIKHIYCNIEDSLIIFSDIERNIYILQVHEDDFTCRMIYAHHSQIQQLCLSQSHEVVIVNEDMGVTFLKVDWLEMELQTAKDEPFLKSYYRGDKTIVHYAKYREWQKSMHKPRNVEPDNYFVHINSQNELTSFDQPKIDKYSHQFERDSEIIITSGKDYVLVFNKTQSCILSVFEELSMIIPVDDNLMADLKPNNFLVNFKKDLCHNVLLQIRVFGSLVGEKWSLHQYEVNKSSIDPHQAFLKKNLHIIFQFNGLITPMYQKQVQESLNSFYASKNQYKYPNESRESKMSEPSKAKQFLKNNLNAFELGVALLKTALQYFPNSLHKLLRKLKGNIQFNKTISYTEETHRFFLYAQYIIQEQMDQLIKVSESVEKESLKSTCLRTKDKDHIKKIQNVLQNTILFLHGFINLLRLEIHDNQKQTGGIEYSKKLHQKLEQNQKIYNVARSLFLVAKMMQEDKIVVRFQERFKKIREQIQKCREFTKTKNVFLNLQYYLQLVQEHFSFCRILLKQPKITFVHFIKFLIANRANFVQNAYFYQTVTRRNYVPFLPTDVSNFIQNIYDDVALIKKEDLLMNQINEQQNTKSLLKQMTSMALSLKLYPFIKYMIQLNTIYEEYSLAIMLIFSESFTLPQNYIQEEVNKEQLFVVKSLMIAKRIDLAHLYVLEHYNAELFEQFVQHAYINGNSLQILDLKEKGYISGSDKEKLKELLQIDEKRWSILSNQPYK